MSEVCHVVRIECDLQPITGVKFSSSSAIVDDGARLDIAANIGWFDQAFFDVRVCNPGAQSNRQQ